MSKIIKTEAIVLRKINYSESSLIVSLFTKSNGKISAILKGGRRPNSKLSSVVDLLNHIQVIIYKKESRDIQVISSADLYSYFPNIKSDFTKTTYAYAVCELVNDVYMEGEVNELMFNGLVRILNLMNNKEENSAILFIKFFIFFLKEIGYELNLELCKICSKELSIELKPVPFGNEGFICLSCQSEHKIQKMNESELFNFLSCLKNRKKLNYVNDKLIESAIKFLLNYLRNHLENFKGLQSLEINHNYSGGIKNV
ncbi:MAG: DNA repair protein RecO [Ignavibacterium sp.]|nr:DNA repair protein RecO [Ignavibacterium sp.]